MVVSPDCEACCSVQVVQPTEQNKICTAVRATEQPLLSTITKKCTDLPLVLLVCFDVLLSGKETRHHIKKQKTNHTGISSAFRKWHIL